MICSRDDDASYILSNQERRGYKPHCIQHILYLPIALKPSTACFMNCSLRSLSGNVSAYLCPKLLMCSFLTVSNLSSASLNLISFWTQFKYFGLRNFVALNCTLDHFISIKRSLCETCISVDRGATLSMTNFLRNCTRAIFYEHFLAFEIISITRVDHFSISANPLWNPRL